MTRRAFCVAGTSAAVGVLVGCSRRTPAGKSASSTPPAPSAGGPAAGGPVQNVTLVEFTDAGQSSGTVQLPKVIKSEAEWRAQLSKTAFEVTRKESTEWAFSGEYWNLHDKGLYRCICCDTALFSSETKFESGTGWPSFWQPIAKENVLETSDRSLGIERTAVSCRRCDAHLGHVFNDGPPPTGLRYCMNSVSLRFIRIGTA